jgi:hypothetical protein
MRNDNSDDWTAVSTMETESFVEVRRVDNAALDFVVTPRHGMVGMDSSMATTQACVTITACEIPDDDDKRAPDVTTSMYGKKLELCKRTLEVRSIFPLPDGHANEGVTNGPDLVSIVKSFSTCSLPVGQFSECRLDETQKDPLLWIWR